MQVWRGAGRATGRRVLMRCPRRDGLGCAPVWGARYHAGGCGRHLWLQGAAAAPSSRHTYCSTDIIRASMRLSSDFGARASPACADSRASACTGWGQHRWTSVFGASSPASAKWQRPADLSPMPVLVCAREGVWVQCCVARACVVAILARVLRCPHRCSSAQVYLQFGLEP